jgi:hypothetical protein
MKSIVHASYSATSEFCVHSKLFFRFTKFWASSHYKSERKAPCFAFIVFDGYCLCRINAVEGVSSVENIKGLLSLQAQVLQSCFSSISVLRHPSTLGLLPLGARKPAYFMRHSHIFIYK